jgi:V8-like Glu-specific endopeptidase
MSASPIAPTPLVNAPPNAVGSALMGVVDLKVTYPDSQTAMGTGALIDSSHVLTAAHLLYSAKDGGYATSIEAIPAANGLGHSVGVAYGTYERVDPSWLSFNPSHPGATSPTVEDIGLVTLNRPIGNSTGWFGLGYSNKKAFFTGATFDTAGYPGSLTNSLPQLRVEAGKELGTVSNDITFMQSSLAALPGQSGSPIYQVSGKGAPVIYGVLTGADGYSPSSTVYAARLTPSVIAELQSWEKADKTLGIPTPYPGASLVTIQHPAVTATQPQGVASASPRIRALDYYWQYNSPNYSQFYGPTYNGYSYVTPWGDTVQAQTDNFTPYDYTRYDVYQNAPYMYQYYETQSQPWYDLWEDPAW